MILILNGKRLSILSLASFIASLAVTPQQWVEREAYLMGTTLKVVVAVPQRSLGIEAIEEAFQAVRRLEGLLSTWRDDSEIARLNFAPPGQAISLSAQLYTLLQEAARWSRLTGGAFDPAIGSLVDAWDLRGPGQAPDSATLRRARAAASLKRFRFDDSAGTVSRTDSASWIDTGGFGKGVALREAGRALSRRGVTTGSLNFGGQVLVLGRDRGGDWLVPVAHPRHRKQPAAWLHLRDRSASTSSQSERFVTVHGQRRGHIVDPRTGIPGPPWGSVTVVAEDPAVADIVSTALLVLGPDHGLRWAQGRRDVAVLFLIERGTRLERRWNAALEEFLVADSTHSGGA